MRLLTLKLLHRSPPSPPPFLHHLFSHYSSYCFSPRSSLISSTILHHRQHDYFNPCCSSTSVNLLNPNYSISLNRRFSSVSDDPILPVRALISLLDSYHDVTGLPWWFIISSSTVAMRFSLLPLIILQMKKMRRIGELLSKLPPPFPPPLSGRSFRGQFSLFWKEKQAVGCPSMLWFLSSFAVQVPCFFLWIMSIRSMSLNHHSGFDCGGTLWFQNLTEYPNGVLGPVFPLIIAGLHYTNVQITFKSSLQQLSGPLGSLAKLYKLYLELLTLPILFATFNVPQGSLVYWLTNSSMSLIQHKCLTNPDILEYIGLPKRDDPVVAPTNKEISNLVVAPTNNKEIGNLAVADFSIRTKEGLISAGSLSPQELVSYSVKVLTDGRMDIAMQLLRLALEKDPGYVRGMLIMGQTLLQQKQFVEAIECLESAVSKLLVAGHPSGVEEVDSLILSSQWAGIAYIQQGKMEEGLLHLERIAQLEEPVDPVSKAHYFDGLFMLSSALLNVERKDEAMQCLQKLAAYDPAKYNKYFQDLETDFTDDLASSRRDF